jgi:predicted DCC family thiol-disulfide oxidoreductase YuxK
MDAVIFYDGDCGFCRKWVRFIVNRDRADSFRFASLKSEYARRMFGEKGFNPTDLNSVVLVDSEEIFLKSDAVIAIAKRLGAPWKYFGIAELVPKILRDSVYQWIAENRHRFSSQNEICEPIDNDNRAKFLDEAELKS